MSLSLLPTAALAEESDVTEPLAEETAADSPTLSDETRPPEDAATEEVLDDGDEENVLDDPALFKDARPSEELTEEEALADPEGGEADASQPEIAPISIDPGDTNAEKVKNYFANGGLASTYVTKRHTDGQSDTAWSIVDRRGRRRISLLRRRGRRRHGDL